MRLALVPGSGGPRGFADIGVLKVLLAAGLSPDLIVGSSIGAIVGALVGSRPIEQLDIAFAAVATRLPDGLAVAFARGDTADSRRRNL